jgi:hypothetical protein
MFVDASNNCTFVCPSVFYARVRLQELKKKDLHANKKNFQLFMPFIFLSFKCIFKSNAIPGYKGVKTS